MILGYNTNGFAHHRLSDAIEILAELGYRGIALTLDVHHLDPFAVDHGIQLQLLKARLEKHKLAVCIETGARFLLNPGRKHRPTLLDPAISDRKKRFAFLSRCMEIAAQLNATCVSFWSGTAKSDESSRVLMKRLTVECQRLCELADRNKVRLAFEPEPGMFIDTMPKFRELFDHVEHPRFGLTLDVGHLICMDETPIGPIIRQWAPRLWNVHLDDMKRGVHDHLLFGEGEVPFSEMAKALREIKFKGIASVELSRHSHDAVNTALKSIHFLQKLKRS